ncbi:deleted in malignant brain tumors 1 protein isoform X3 [Strongylocentrotus purpuratus]|uniref:SRCR domain-containing protein n=1 Tax=Strongylocentrotus purpuratus TaxID=7668 RepID=A0A7M7P3A2_STRPU|nr:deleted in malignant brain tumors 1 protein isoform X3 [Strongylocentrotus purpuratus]
MMESYTILSLLLCLGVASAYSNFDVRLVGTGSNEWMGRVEVFYNGEWGTVCDDYWGLEDAKVVCRQLGYTGGASGFTIGAEFGQGSEKIFLDDVRCDGTENRITNCTYLLNTVGGTNCRHSEDSGVKCQGPRSTDEVVPAVVVPAVVVPDVVVRDGDVRLAGAGSSANQGRVEVYDNGQWGTVCNDLWDIRNALVVCRQLGFRGATSSRDQFGQGTGPILLDNVECGGDETSIMECRKNPIRSHNCYHHEDAGVICSDAILVRLVGPGSSANQGRVEVYANGRWGTVCHDLWDIQNANVVCRQLGFPRATAATSGARFGQGTGPILLDNVECEGDETSIMECRKNAIESHNCYHREDAGVICQDDKKRQLEDVEFYLKKEEQMAAAPVSDGKTDDDLKTKDILQALSDLLAELKDK